MKFDANHKPNRANLSPTVVAMMDRAFYARRPAGLNVQFINEVGDLDEWSFASIDSRDQFLAGLQKQGRDFAVSA